MVSVEELYKEAEKSPCLRLNVGCIGVTKTGERVYGHNHMKDGSPCEISMELSKPDVFHAECHVLSQVEIGDIDRLYITHSPCLQCSKEIVRYQVPYVEYIENYRLLDGIQFLMENNVTVIQKDISNDEITSTHRVRSTQEPHCCIDFARLG